MILAEFDTWARSFLEIDQLRQIDDSLNGIQVACSSSKPIQKIAVAVDACAESIKRARSMNADLLFVHHGLFWGKPEPLVGSLRERLKMLFDSDMALYACHLPLDRHPDVGNNAQLANLLGLKERKAFGIYHGISIGWSGVLPKPTKLDQIIAKILPDGSAAKSVIAAGPKEIKTVAIVSGGAPFESLEAITEGIDLYITGEPSHSIYHYLIEGGINFIAAGHYATEIWGVKAIAEKAHTELGLDTIFLDIPTGL
ncbi:MAG: putative GTP cyclohydrolase 1 type 2 [Spirochaetes bacterium ADurb.Bin110]|nr:MAG: putative GTP cyclohydrolase 1 type 2 [Spirochaetes bacterium ADurb.Bin110]